MFQAWMRVSGSHLTRSRGPDQPPQVAGRPGPKARRRAGQRCDPNKRTPQAQADHRPQTRPDRIASAFGWDVAPGQDALAACHVPLPFGAWYVPDIVSPETEPE